MALFWKRDHLELILVLFLASLKIEHARGPGFRAIAHDESDRGETVRLDLVVLLDWKIPKHGSLRPIHPSLNRLLDSDFTVVNSHPLPGFKAVHNRSTGVLPEDFRRLVAQTGQHTRAASRSPFRHDARSVCRELPQPALKLFRTDKFLEKPLESASLGV